MSTWPEAAPFAALNAALRELIEIDPEQREPGLQAWCAQHPQLAPQLQRLLASVDADAEATQFTVSLQRVVAASLLRVGSTVGAGEQLGDWTLHEWRGRGGMAEVWLALGSGAHRDQRAAIKRPLPGRATPQALAGFERERGLLATLDDPRIARLIDAGVDGEGHPWLAMEYVAGERIDHWCDRQRLRVAARVRILREVALAVHSAHRALVVHGDIKPANVLVTAGGDIKLLDFGIARLVMAEADDHLAMTPQYASPEQLRGLNITPASDVYQLGLMLCELLAGTPPLQCEPPSQIFAAADRAMRDGIASARSSTAAALARTLRGDLDAIARRALAPHPEQRYDSALQLAEELECWLAKRPVRARLPTLRYRCARLIARNALASLIGALLAAVLIAYVSTSLIQAERLRREAQINLEVRDYLIQMLRQTDPLHSGQTQPTTQTLLERSLTHARAQFAGQPDLLAEVLTVGADTLIRGGDFARAASLLREALDTLPAAPSARLHALLARHGQTLHYLARYADAERSLREAEATWYAANAPGDPLITLALADVLHSRGDYGAAIDVLERVGRLPLSPFARAVWQRDFGILLRDAGDVAAARTLLDQSLETLSSRFAQDVASVASAQLALARLEVVVGAVERARALAMPALVAQQQIYGEHHAVLGMARHTLALTAFIEQRFASAETQLTAVIDLDYAGIVADNVILAYARLDRAWCRLGSGRDADARADLALAESALRAVSSAGHPRWAEAQLARAVLALHGADRSAAGSLIEAAVTMRTAALGSEHPLTREAVSWRQTLAGIAPSGDVNRLAERRLQLLRNALGADATR